MAARDRYIIGYPDVRFLTSSNSYLLFVLSVNNVENFLVSLLSVCASRVYGLEYNIVSFRFVNVDYIHESIFVSNGERKVLFAQLAVKLFKLNDHLTLVNLDRAFGLEPALQTFEMD